MHSETKTIYSVSSEALQQKAQTLANHQVATLTKMKEHGVTFDVKNQFSGVFNGFSIETSPKQLDAIRPCPTFSPLHPPSNADAPPQ